MSDAVVKSEEMQRWTSKRKIALVMEILKGEISPAEAARKYDLTVADIERWKERFLSGAENALRNRPKDEETQKDKHIAKLERKVGRMALEIDIMQEAIRPYLPFEEKTSDE